MRYAQLPEPTLPTGEAGRGWLRVQNTVCGICASDLHLLFVDVDPRVHSAALPGYSRLYLGHEAASRVTETNPGCSLKPGDRVLMKSRFLNPTCDSQSISPRCRHCENGDYALCENAGAGVGARGVGGGWGDGYTCHESEVWQAPDFLSDDAVSLIEPLACGVRAALRRLPQPGEKALVVGCGMIGLGTVQALRALAPGALVYAAARYPQQIAMAERWGATVVRGDMFEIAERETGARVHTGDFSNRSALGGFDVVYDCVGNDASVQQALRLTRAGGTVVIVGVYLKPMSLDLTPVWHQEVNLIGALAHGAETWEGLRWSTFDLTAELLRRGVMTHEGYITHRFRLEQWREAVRTATDKHSGAIKVVFDYT